MANVTILVCACGMRLKAAGATPGRVGKCPACGGTLRVPSGETAAASLPPAEPKSSTSDYGLASTAAPRPSTYTPQRSGSTRGASAVIRNGWIRVPSQPETRLRESLLYPFWGETGIALLALMPPAFWLISLPLLMIFLSWSSGNLGTGLVALTGLLPAVLVLMPVLGFTLLYFGRVIVTSAVGEVHHPRWPDWEPAEMVRGLGRWAWAILTGGVLGGFPSVAYWLYCGDVDVFDAIILIELTTVGAVYGQVALLASILYEDALGAHPLTVLRALRRVGWSWLVPSLMSVSFVILAGLGLTIVLEIGHPLISAFAYWAYWVFLLYGSMVVLRVLGLFYHRHARVLGWFRERPRWGG